MRITRSRKGFALPMALLVMVVLTAGIAAGYAATSAEVVTNAAHRGDTRAYNLAAAGLTQFLARRGETNFCSLGRCASDPMAANSPGDSVRIQLTGGYADVVSVLVRKHVNDTMPALYLIYSRGVDQSIKLS